MSRWKPEYFGFPRGFLRWCWELHRGSFVAFTVLGIGSLVYLALYVVVFLI